MYMNILRRLPNAVYPRANVDGELNMKHAFSQMISRFLTWLTNGVDKSAKEAGACPT